jgi:hypothetical protein
MPRATSDNRAPCQVHAGRVRVGSMPARAAAALLAAIGLTGGCSTNEPAPPTTEPTFQTLVPLEGWSSVARDADPFIDDPSAPPPACVGPGFRLEPIDDWLEIDTGLCNWVTLVGSAVTAVSEGQLLKLTVSHYNLEAGAPAEAHLSLTLDECEAWSKQIAIPGPAAVYEEQFASPCALAAGGRVLFHLDNHGQNTYQLQELSSLRTP